MKDRIDYNKNIVTLKAPCASITRDYSISAVSDGPAMNVPK